MSNTYLISVISPSIRPHLWNGLYDNIKNNNQSSFEIVFVGDKEPDFKLHDNFRFIYSKVKPVQCMEIAVRNARGKYIFDGADDLLYSPHFFDNMVNKMELIEREDICFSPMISIRGIIKIGAMRVVRKDLNSPIVGMISFLRRSMWEKIGGLDSNFTSIWANHDLKLRLLEMGGRCIMMEECIADEKPRGNILRFEYSDLDRSYLLSCWYKDNKFNSKRLKPFCGFSDQNILLHSQGPKGKWE